MPDLTSPAARSWEIVWAGKVGASFDQQEWTKRGRTNDVAVWRSLQQRWRGDGVREPGVFDEGWRSRRWFDLRFRYTGVRALLRTEESMTDVVSRSVRAVLYLFGAVIVAG